MEKFFQKRKIIKFDYNVLMRDKFYYIYITNIKTKYYFFTMSIKQKRFR